MRVILHSDINNCYASIESIEHPEYKNIPMAVGGDEEKRHGIILAKNERAKKFGIKTGEPLWQARIKCPEIKILRPNFPLYQKYCSLAKKLYSEYTDLTEAFGPDEAWLDVTASMALFGSGEKIAEEIRNRMKKELGLTVSIGVSFNKIFAKFGSDYKKPDAVTVISEENYKDIVWREPVSYLLFVGRSTAAALNRRGIFTIGDIVRTGREKMRGVLGKNGEKLYIYAAGMDTEPVCPGRLQNTVKSIGNSTTPPRDIKNFEDAKIIMYILSENIAERLRQLSLNCRGVQISLKDTSFIAWERQKKLKFATSLSETICAEAMELLKECHIFPRPLRSLGVRAFDLCSENAPFQLSFFRDESALIKKKKLELTAEKIKERYGKESIVRAVILSDPVLGLSAKPDETFHTFGAH